MIKWELRQVWSDIPESRKGEMILDRMRDSWTDGEVREMEGRLGVDDG
jgi:hypothetical protein